MGRLAAQFEDNAEPKQTFFRPECSYIVIESQPHKNIGTKKMAPHKNTVNLQEEIWCSLRILSMKNICKQLAKASPWPKLQATGTLITGNLMSFPKPS